MTSANIFVSIATDAPPAQVTARSDHPVAPQGIVNQSAPISTNKFYANFFLGGRTQSTWTHPYSVMWANGSGQTGSWGIAIAHIERTMLAYGPGNPAQFFINPIGIQSMVLSARELGSTTSLTMDSLQAFSANVNLAPGPGASPVVTFPLVQGMGFITAIYNSSTPMLQSGVFFNTLTYGGAVAASSGASFRYQAMLNDGSQWLIYITPLSGFTARY
ncbi:hypothetical protein MRB53_037390 [Persea americana]|nr:hypothetical protein MRB53_037390 [Persea americana]